MSAQPAPPTTPPRRHGEDLATARRIASKVRLSLLGQDVAPTPEQWHALGMALWRGDALADDVAAWLLDEGMASARPKLERAIAHGLAAVPDAPPALRRYIEAAERMPDWADPALMDAGARFIHSTGQYGMLVLRDAGLMAGYQAGAINQTLVMTGALKKGPQRRVAETTSWWLDVTREGGMRRDGKGFKTTLQVRVMHALVRRSVARRPEWDAARLGLPVNQADMQATYLGFSVVHLLALKGTGVFVSPADAHAMMHLWRYICWLMGVDDDLLFETEREGRIGLYHNLLSQAPPDESSVALGRALMDEPLSRHYPWAGFVRGRFNKARHLSLTRWFVGREGMRHLGLPASWPWHPLMTLVPRFLWTGLHRLVPGGYAALIARGQRAQMNYLSIMFGPTRQGVAEIGAVDRRPSTHA